MKAIWQTVLSLLLAVLVVEPSARIVAADSWPVGRQAPPSAGPADPAELEAFFDGHMPQQLEAGHGVGAIVAVVRDGRVLLAKGYGYADLDERRPIVGNRTLFYIGSAGKLFTWTAVMQLVEQGRLDLDADVNTYLDFAIPPTFSEPITMRHLMTHTAGFEEQLAAMLSEPGDFLPLRDFLVGTMPRRIYPPGRYFAYSNYGAALAGHAVERVSGEPYERYLANHILEPLRMAHSSAAQPLPVPLLAEMSKGYRYQGGAYTSVDFEWIAAAPAAPIRATAADVAKFMIAHLQDGRYGSSRILKEGTAHQMHRQQFTHDPRLPGVAYGFVLSRENDRHIIWHDGRSARFSTILALLPEERAGLLVSYNTAGMEPRTVLSAFLDRYYPPSARPRPLPDGDARTERLAGTYVSAQMTNTTPQKLITWSGAWEVRLDADGRLDVGGQRYAEIEPGLFQQVDGERRLTFAEDAQGQVTHLFWGFLAFFRVPWYQAPALHLGVLTGCLTLFLSALVGWPIHALLRRRPRAPVSATGPRLARWLAGLLGLTSLTLTVWFAVLMLRYADTFVYPAAEVELLTRLCWLLVPSMLAVMAFGVLAWRDRYWSLPWRLHYTLVALGSATFVAWLYYWNFLSPGA